MTSPKPCRRCLLSEMNDETGRQIIERGVNGISEKDRAEKKVYEERLSICRFCDKLLSGTCLSCGCYVEIRAAINQGRCPDKKW